VSDDPEGPESYYRLELPVHFRCMEPEASAEEHLAVAVIVSNDSFLLRSPLPLSLGSLLALRVRVPIEISGSPFSQRVCVGCVVSDHELEDGTTGYKVRIEPAAPRRSAQLPT
jgi:hypothetical protein